MFSKTEKILILNTLKFLMKCALHNFKPSNSLYMEGVVFESALNKKVNELSEVKPKIEFVEVEENEEGDLHE